MKTAASILFTRHGLYFISCIVNAQSTISSVTGMANQDGKESAGIRVVLSGWLAVWRANLTWEGPVRSYPLIPIDRECWACHCPHPSMTLTHLYRGTLFLLHSLLFLPTSPLPNSHMLSQPTHAHTYPCPVSSMQHLLYSFPSFFTLTHTCPASPHIPTRTLAPSHPCSL